MKKKKFSKKPFQNRSFEKIGFIPRSIIRTSERFIKQVFLNNNFFVIQEFRISRYQTLVSIRCLMILIFLPIIFEFLVKTICIYPLVESFWNRNQTEIFLNKNQQKKAFLDFQKIEEELYFDSLISYHESLKFPIQCCEPKNSLQSSEFLQQKIINLAKLYNKESIVLLTNLISRMLTIFLIISLFIFLKPQIIILKSFLTESIYSLNDVTKSFLLILLTDLLVGFHSSKGWGLIVQNILISFGFSEREEFTFLFISTFPVLLDTVFKYWIFRYLNKISPSTVATYQSMIE